MHPVSGPGTPGSQLPVTTSASGLSTPSNSTSALAIDVREVGLANGEGRRPSLAQLLLPRGTMTGAGLLPETGTPSTPTQPPPVDVDARFADQTDGRAEPPSHTGAVDALLNFIQQPPSPRTSRLLDRFEAVQARFERHVNAQVVADMRTSPIERPQPLETPAPIHEGMQAHMDATPSSPANANADASTTGDFHAR